MKLSPRLNAGSTTSLRKIAWSSILLLTSVECFSASLSISFTNESFWNHNGVIKLASTGRVIGSGFVVGPRRDVVTCLHVLESARTNFNETNLLFASQTLTTKLQLKAALSGYDIAVFSTMYEISGPPLYLGNFGKMKPGDTILYLGYDIRTSSTSTPRVSFHLGTVQAKVPMTNEGVKVEALLFTGEAIPGYSGGAVYNTNMDIVALITKAVPQQKANMAFSMAPLLELQKTPASSTVNTNLPSPR